jgi:hypothetical protein
VLQPANSSMQSTDKSEIVFIAEGVNFVFLNKVRHLAVILQAGLLKKR